MGHKSATLPLTADDIDAAIERARRRACPPTGRDCLAFPWAVHQVEWDAAGWALIGWLHDPTTRTDWHVWLDPATGAGRLRRW